MGKGSGILLNGSMDLDIRVVRDANGLILSGFVVGNVTAQNQQIILLSEKGEIKESPKMGVGLNSHLDDDRPSELLREIRQNLTDDGQKIETIRINDAGKLEIKSGYD